MIFLTTSVLSLGLAPQIYMWRDHKSVRKKLSAIQAASVTSVTVHLGRTFRTPVQDVALPPPSKRPLTMSVLNDLQTLVIRDPKTIRLWKSALTTSYQKLRSPDEPDVSEGSGDRVDYVRLDLRTGERISYLLYGPYYVQDSWGKEVDALYRKAVADALALRSGRRK